MSKRAIKCRHVGSKKRGPLAGWPKDTEKVLPVTPSSPPDNRKRPCGKTYLEQFHAKVNEYPDLMDEIRTTNASSDQVWRLVRFGIFGYDVTGRGLPFYNSKIEFLATLRNLILPDFTPRAMNNFGLDRFLVKWEVKTIMTDLHKEFYPEIITMIMSIYDQLPNRANYSVHDKGCKCYLLKNSCQENKDHILWSLRLYANLVYYDKDHYVHFKKNHFESIYGF
jgi:hypothetical protein